MIGVALIVALSLHQVPVTGVVSYGTAACNQAKLSGYVPFSTRFTCNMHPGQDGCVISDVMALDFWTGSEYRRFCQLQAYGSLPPLLDVRTILSGVELDTSGPVSHHGVVIDFKRTSLNLATYEVGWSVAVNWQNQPVTMVDSFEVIVNGMFVFTAQDDIVFTETSFGCNSSGDSCSQTKLVKQGDKDWGGLALNKVVIQAPTGTYPSDHLSWA